jgi:hypothetical protein
MKLEYVLNTQTKEVYIKFKERLYSKSWNYSFSRA